MNPLNQPTRQYQNNTCELSIEDKKSPFPAWMKFNKPNPLKFSLSLANPDRPDQTPTVVTGDRVKLESLHQAVGEYVNELLAKAPIPELQDHTSSGAVISALPISPPSFDSSPTTETDNTLERPIDALKLTGDQPHLEADGPSGHLLYLGNMATNGQVMLSLSTLQLFDLSTTLEEGIINSAPVQDNSLASADLGLNSAPPPPPRTVAPEVIAATSAPIAEPITTNQFQADVDEPRVILPSVEETISEDSLITESSLFERDSDTSNSNFKSRKPNLGSLNLPELPDFSNSPLTSIWLWLGLGTVATGIVAFPFISPLFNSVESSNPKPSVQNTVNPTAISSLPPEYNSSPAPLPSGIGSSPTSTLGSTPTPNTTISVMPSTNTVSPYGSQPYGNPYSYGNPGGTNPQTPTGTLGNTSISGNRTTTTVPGSTSIPRNQAPGNTSRQAPTTTFRDPSSVLNSNRTNSTSGRTVTSNPSRGGEVPVDPTGDQEFARLTKKDPEAAANAGSSSRRSRSAAISPVTVPSANNPDLDIAGQNTDLFANPSTRIDNPVTSFPVDNAPNLGAPSATNSVDSPQMKGTQQYFQRRWKGDANFNDSLQYVLRVSKSGQVVSIDGQTEASRQYLSRTNFLKPGTKIAESSKNGQDQNVRVILNTNGSVETLTEP